MVYILNIIVGEYVVNYGARADVMIQAYLNDAYILEKFIQRYNSTHKNVIMYKKFVFTTSNEEKKMQLNAKSVQQIITGAFKGKELKPEDSVVVILNGHGGKTNENKKVQYSFRLSSESNLLGSDILDSIKKYAEKCPVYIIINSCGGDTDYFPNILNIHGQEKNSTSKDDHITNVFLSMVDSESFLGSSNSDTYLQDKKLSVDIKDNTKFTNTDNKEEAKTESHGECGVENNENILKPLKSQCDHYPIVLFGFSTNNVIYKNTRGVSRPTYGGAFFNGIFEMGFKLSLFDLYTFAQSILKKQNAKYQTSLSILYCDKKERLKEAKMLLNKDLDFESDEPIY